MEEIEKIQVDKELEMLLLRPENQNIYFVIRDHFITNIDFNKHDLKEGVTKIDFINVLVLSFLNNRIFPILLVIYLFKNQPFKCISWIKGELSVYDATLFELIKHLILIGVKDKIRFENNIEYLEMIKQEIELINYDELKDVSENTCGMIEYFIEKNGYPADKFVKGYFAVRGFLKTESEIVNEFMKEHYDAILNQLQNKNRLTSINNSFREGQNTKPLGNFLDYFENTSKYKSIMELLVKQNFCQPNTYIWKDEGKGSKSLLVAIIKYLHRQKYYKDSKRPSDLQIINITKSTFGVDISIDTVKKAKPENFDLSYIPPSSTIS